MSLEHFRIECYNIQREIYDLLALLSKIHMRHLADEKDPCYGVSLDIQLSYNRISSMLNDVISHLCGMLHKKYGVGSKDTIIPFRKSWKKTTEPLGQMNVDAVKHILIDVWKIYKITKSSNMENLRQFSVHAKFLADDGWYMSKLRDIARIIDLMQGKFMKAPIMLIPKKIKKCVAFIEFSYAGTHLFLNGNENNSYDSNICLPSVVDLKPCSYNKKDVSTEIYCRLGLSPLNTLKKIHADTAPTEDYVDYVQHKLKPLFEGKYPLLKYDGGETFVFATDFSREDLHKFAFFPQENCSYNKKPSSYLKGSYKPIL